MNAPEKIYLSAIDLEEVGHLLTESNDRDDVEYIRTDAFINKACAWINDNANKYWGTEFVDSGEMAEEFRNYMKGE